MKINPCFCVNLGTKLLIEKISKNEKTGMDRTWKYGDTNGEKS